MTKKQAQSMIARLKAEAKIMGAQRDRLRELHGEAEALLDSCQTAEEGLEMAIDALSQYA